MLPALQIRNHIMHAIKLTHGHENDRSPGTLNTNRTYSTYSKTFTGYRAQNSLKVWDKNHPLAIESLVANISPISKAIESLKNFV